MFNTQRKRAVVLALIAFFCGATAYVSVDWKRFGGGFLAFLQHKGDPVVARSGGGSSTGAASALALTDSRPNTASLPSLGAAPARHHANRVGGAGGHASEDDLFKYGDPAAGGMPAGSFVVAQNDTPAGSAGGEAPLSIGAPAAPEVPVGTAGAESGGGVSPPAPAPILTAGGGDGGIVVTAPAPPPSGGSPSSAPTPVASTPPAATPPAQSGTSDQNPGDGGGDTPPVVTPPVSASAVPEASNVAMMGLGALFLAVAAARRRRDGQA